MQYAKHSKDETKDNFKIQRRVQIPDGRWRAYIEVAGKRKSLGRFDTEFEAACARLKAEQKDPDWHCDLQDHNTKTILKEIL